MKIVFVIISFGISSFLWGQSEQRSIELPDFVITGKQSVEVPIALKKKPDLISTLSQEFFMPQYSPEELSLLISSVPISQHPSITPTDDYISGSLNVGAGIHTLPIGEFYLSKSFDNYLISAKAWGSNIKEYINNAGYNISGMSLDNNFFISTKSSFLPGTNIKLFGQYSRDSYKFYGSVNPNYKRETNKSVASISAINKYDRLLSYGFSLDASYLNLSENNLGEKTLKIGALAELKLNSFTVGMDGFYRKQFLNNNLSKINNYNFYSAEGYLKVYPMQMLSLKIGATFTGNSINSFFSPIGSFQLDFDRGFVLQVNFEPHVRNYTISDFINSNIYMDNGVIDNIISEEKVNLKTTLKYEYQKYFSISIWSSYSQTNNYLYFEDIIQNGFFEVRVVNKANSFAGGIDFLFQPGMFGYLYSEMKYQSVKDQNDKFIPYIPRLFASIIYGYDFSFGIEIKAKYKIAQDIFTDLTNSNKLKNYNNLSATVSYKILNNLSLFVDFQNILNRSNFVLKQYEEKPLDLIIGVEYRW